MYGDTPYGGYAAAAGYGPTFATDYNGPEMAGFFKKLKKAVKKVVKVAAPVAALAIPVAGPALGLGALATGALTGGVKLASGFAAGRAKGKVSQVATIRSVGTARRPAATAAPAARWRGPSTALTKHWNKHPGRTVPQAVKASKAAASAMVGRAQTQSAPGASTTAPGGGVQPVSIDWGDLIGRGLDTIGDIFGGGGGGGGGGNNTGPAPSPTPTPNAGAGVGTGLAIAAGVGLLAVLMMKRGR